MVRVSSPAKLRPWSGFTAKMVMGVVPGLVILGRGPAAILFISRDTCSDSIANLFRACFYGGIAQLSRDMLQNGVSHRGACVKLSTKGGYRTILGECC